MKAQYVISLLTFWFYLPLWGADKPAGDIEHLKGKAEKGEASAQFELGEKYYYGSSVEKDFAEAEKWYHKAAGQNHASAQYNLGLMYWHGKGVEKDISRAYLWWSLAAEKDHVAAKISKRHAKLKLTPEQIKKIDQLEKQWSAWKLYRGWPENPQDTREPFSTLEKKFGFRVHWRQGDILAPSHRQSGQAKEVRQPALKRLPNLLKKALAKYPPWVIQKHLNHVRFAEDLSFHGKDYGGTIDEKTKSIYVDVAIKDYSTSVDIENIIHHEFATFMMDIHDFPANAWIKFNPPGFEYEDPEGHGSNVIGKKRGPTKKFWPLGFVRGYSQASLDNDFENFSALIFTEPRKAKLLIDRFPKLKDKYHLWLKVHQKIDGNFFIEERLFPKNLFAQKQPEKVEEIEILEIKGTHYCLPTGKPYSGKTVNFGDKEKTQKNYETIYREGKDVSKSWFWYHKEGWLSQEALYQNEKKISTTFFHPNGKKSREIPYKEGTRKEWYDNGQQMYEAIYKGDKLEGLNTYWDKEGRIEQKVVFQNDKKISATYFDWHPNGKRKIERPFKNEKEEGLSTYWYPNGKKEKQLTYKAGKLDGPSTWWYDNGNKKIEAMYQNGNEIRNKTKFLNPDGTPK